MDGFRERARARNWQIGTGLCVVLMVSVMAAGIANAQPHLDPRYDWQTLVSENFRIHFKADHLEAAQQTALIAERVHEQLAGRLDWHPSASTEVVLVDEFDLPTGMATPFPYNWMLLNLSPSEPGGIIPVIDRAQWLEALIRHEYTHILHLDMARGHPKGLRRWFGRNPLLFPNLYQPLWVIEGLATHLETDERYGVGRGQTAEFAMIMRAELDAGIRSLGSASIPNQSWPAGTVPYVYGVHFIQFIEDRYGEQALTQFIHQFSGQLIPFALNRAASEVFNRDIQTLWSEFEQWLEERYRHQIVSVRNDGVVEGERLTELGEVGRLQPGSLDATDDGAVYFVRDSGKQQPELVKRHTDGHIQSLVRLNRGARFSAHPEAGVVVAQPEVCRERRIYFDLFLLAPDQGRLTRLTHCARYREAAWHPDGRRMVAVRHEQGRAYLDLLSSEGELLQALPMPPDVGLMAHPDWSPNGTRLMVTASRHGGGMALMEYDLASGRWSTRLETAYQAITPRYADDGKSVYFSIDDQGIYDLRRLDLSNGQWSGLTRVVTGAFDPVPMADGSVYYLGYSDKGYDLRRLPAAAETLHVAHSEHGTAELAPDRPAIESAYPVTRYSALPTLAPRFWMPHLDLDDSAEEVGAATLGRDALGIHSYQAALLWDFMAGEPGGWISYLWSDRINLAFERRHREQRIEPELETANRRFDEALIGFRLPITRLEQSWSLLAGGAYEHARLIDRPPQLNDVGRFRDTLVGLAVTYDNANRYRFSISRQQGRWVRLVSEQSISPGDFSGTVHTLDWREFIHLGGNHVLALRYMEGRGSRDARPFELGGTRGQGVGIGAAPGFGGIFNQRRIALRGYAEGQPELTGRNMRLAAAEWRFPLSQKERGYNAPAGLRRLSGTVFVEGGAAGDGASVGGLNMSAGTEAVLDIALGYWLLPLQARLGFAHGFDADVGGENVLYLRFGAAF